MSKTIENDGYYWKYGKIKTNLCLCGNEKNYKSMICKNCKNHNMSNSREYHIWEGMIQRCNNINSKNYKTYGGRGIKVCKRWLRFTCFFEDMGKAPAGKELDRINNNKGYSKKNCKWSNKSEQAINRRNKINSTTGEKNIRYVCGKYYVSVKRELKNNYIGSFVTLKEAKKARDKFCNEYRYER